MEHRNRDEFIRLARDLERIDAKRYAVIIERCRSGAYDDFANDEFAAPKVKMVEDLLAVGLNKEAEDVITGKYDQ